VEEFLEKLQEDQRRMRKFLRGHRIRFKQMGEILAQARNLGSRVFVIAEPPLEALARLIAEEYLVKLPVLHIDLSTMTPASVDPDESVEGPPATPRAAAARQVGRHLHPGDVIMAFLHEGQDVETRKVLEIARAKRIPVLVIGGLGAKGHYRRIAKVRINLPTRGIKTICESVFVCSRILGRISRGALADGGEEEERLVQAVCETCNERIFMAEHTRGKRATCPLCEGETRIPRTSERRAAPSADSAVDSTVGVVAPVQKRRKRKLKPSVLDYKVPSGADSGSEDASPGSHSGASEPTVIEEEDASVEAAPVEADLEDADLEEADLDDADLDDADLDDADLDDADLDDADFDDADFDDADLDGADLDGADLDEVDLDDVDLDDADLDDGEPPRQGVPAPARPLESAPMGLVSQTGHELPIQGVDPSFGSDIMVGSDVVISARDGESERVRPDGKPSTRRKPSRSGSRNEGKSPSVTASADPFALEDAFLADLEMPGPGSVPSASSAQHGQSDDGTSRRLSARYTVSDCELRWGRGGYPDDASPANQLMVLSAAGLTFFLNPDDEGGSTLQKGDELWVRIEVPAFIEPIFVRSVLIDITGSSGSGGRGAQAEIEFRDMDNTVRRKLLRAAENMAAPA
jgi:phosphoheptose isomerase